MNIRLISRNTLKCAASILFVTSCAVGAAVAAPSTPPTAVASDLGHITQIVAHPLSPGTSLIVQGDGIVRRLENGVIRRSTFLDIEDLVSEKNQRALFGLAFSPNFAVTRYLYIGYVDRQGDTVIGRLTALTNDEAPADTLLVLMKIVQPIQHVRTGALTFGPDDKLYVATGDGGEANATEDYAQDKKSLLGKVLRLDPGAETYQVPSDNPFINNTQYLPEIFATGVRDPFLVLNTSPLLVADRGQYSLDEINSTEAGANLGWGELEGDRCLLTTCALTPKNSTVPSLIRDRGKGVCLGAATIIKRDDRKLFLMGDCQSGEIVEVDFPLSNSSTLTTTITSIGKPISAIGADSAWSLLVGTTTGELFSVSLR